MLREISLETLWLSSLLLRRMVDSVRRNRGWAVLAVLLSAALWVLITSEQNPPKVDVFPSPIPVEVVNVPSELGVLGEVQFVRVRVSAPPEAWVRLMVSSFRATADLSKASKGIQEIGVRVASNDPQVRVIEVVPPKVMVTVEEIEARQIPVAVNLQGSSPLGITIGTPRPSLPQVLARGPSPLVRQVEAAVADLSLEGIRLPIRKQSFRLTPRSATGTRIEGVVLDPPSVEVELLVEQQIQYRSVSVLPSLRGSVPPGYWVSGLRAEPPAVTVAGAREVLEAVNFLSTQPLDVSAARSDLVRSVDLALPPGISLIGPGTVLAYVSISPAQGTETFSLAPLFNGLSPNLKASASNVSVTLAGSLPRLQQLKATGITVTLDLRNLGAGTYALPPQVVIPEGLEIVQVVPENISVFISTEAEPGGRQG